MKLHYWVHFSNPHSPQKAGPASPPPSNKKNERNEHNTTTVSYMFGFYPLHTGSNQIHMQHRIDAPNIPDTFKHVHDIFRTNNHRQAVKQNKKGESSYNYNYH